MKLLEGLSDRTPPLDERAEKDNQRQENDAERVLDDVEGAAHNDGRIPVIVRALRTTPESPDNNLAGDSRS